MFGMMNRTMGWDIQQLSKRDFPALLTEIPDPPHELYTVGSLSSVAQTKLLAVVGSRKCTDYGKAVVDYLIKGLRGSPVSIVSGLALGIDAHAHRAALSAGIPTLAIPGSGLDPKVLYPKSHFPLAKQIIESDGALLSEYAPTQAAAPWTFPKRNRLMAGIAHATLVVEATEKSGTLITARLASEYDRELLVVPGSIFAETSKGAHQFLKLGATPVTSPVDILHALDIATASLESNSKRLTLSEKEQNVYDLLEEPLAKDVLVEKLSLPITEVHIVLSKLELDGVIIERMGKIHRM